MTVFDKAWNIVKGENPNSDWDEPDDSPHAGTSKCPCRQGYNPCDDPKCAEWHKGAVAKNERFGEKFNEKLRRMKEGARPVPKKFSDLRSTTPERDNFDVMAEILGTDSDGVVDEYERLKDMFDNEPASIPDSSSQALGSKGLIERFKRAGPTPRGPVKKESDEDFLSSQSNFSINPDAMEGKSHAGNYVDDVRSLVEQGMPVMEAVQQVCRLVGCKGRDLMRAYVEAYR